MVWPTHPESIDDIPLDDEDHLTRTRREMATPDTILTLCLFVRRNHWDLDQITQGNPDLEKILGTVLLGAINFGMLHDDARKA